MIYCGSGSVSYFGKVLVPVPAPVPVPDPDLFSSFSSTKTLYKILPFQCQKQHCLPESWPLIFKFFTFVLHFMLDSDPNLVPKPEPECKRSGSSKAKSCGSSVLRIRDVYPGSRILIFTHPGSRIPDLGSQIQKQLQKRGVKNFLLSKIFLQPQISQNVKLFYF